MMKTSGIGGQAVIEGIMMKYKDEYAVAVRRENGEIAVEKHMYRGIPFSKNVEKISLVRGVFSFVDSLVLGMRSLHISAEYMEDTSVKGIEDAGNAAQDGEGGSSQIVRDPKRFDRLVTMLVTCAATMMAVFLFMILPFLAGKWIMRSAEHTLVFPIVEGVIRVCIFLLYLFAISRMKEIKRTFMYHGAEHKCINCIEGRLPLTVEYVRDSSRRHRRCGTSFLFFVVIVSMIVCFFITAETMIGRIGVRILLLPVVAGISYELIRIAGRSDNPIVRILSAPGMWVQSLTTKEPDDGMIEVAIAAVNAVFDWETWQSDHEKTDTADRGQERRAGKNKR